MKAFEQYVDVILFITLYLAFKSGYEISVIDRSDHVRYGAVL